jgi:hypothetical protein
MGQSWRFMHRVNENRRLSSVAPVSAWWALHLELNKGSSGVFHQHITNPTPKGFSQREKTHRVGFAICVGENPLKNPYF